MAVRAACANGNLTSASTWETCDATSYSNSESANTALTTAYVESSTFTPGAITVDAILVKIASRAASPSGTMSIHLATGGVEVTGTAVTVNVSDVPTCSATSGTTSPVDTAEGGWFCLKFAAPVTLLAATAYTVGGKTSSGSQVNLWSSATTNWSRALRTTTTGAPAAGDDLIITGEWTAAATVTARTVTMDSTANTNYGSNTTSQVTPSLSICNNGTLSFGTAASTNYIFQQAGHIVVYNGGTYSQGISGTEIPRGSTAILQFNCASNGDFGLVARKGSTVNIYGLSRTSGKNVSQTKLNANASAGATSVTLVDDTGWLSGDLLCFAPTSQTSTEYESKAATGNATATTIAVSALTNAHSGTSPTQGEVGLLTRNSQFIAVTANVVTFFFIGSTATVNCSWTDFRYVSTNATGKRGLDINTTTGTCNINFCTIRDTGSSWFWLSGASGSGVSITNTVCYNCAVATAAANAIRVNTTSGTWTINNVMFCGGTTAFGINQVIDLQDVGGTFTNCSASGFGSTSRVVSLDESNAIGTISGINVHSNGGSGFGANTTISGTVSTSNSWRNATTGFDVGGGITKELTLSFVTCNAFGNGTNGFLVSNSQVIGGLILDTCTSNGDTAFSQTNALNMGGASATIGFLYMFSCQFSVVSGIKTKCTNDLNFSTSTNYPIIADNCIFNGTNIYANVAGLPNGPFLKAQNFGQVANDDRTYIANGTTTAGLIQTNTGTVYGANPRSEQMTPASASVKLVSASILVVANSGQVVTPTVQVQKNGSYAGSAPRLIVKRQDSIGITADTVLATFSAGSGSWQALSGSTVAATQDGVMEFVVDCDGTAGSVFVGDASAVAA